MMCDKQLVIYCFVLMQARKIIKEEEMIDK
jgi:hypothetical protein